MMGMPITVEVVTQAEAVAANAAIADVFLFFDYVDRTFSPYKADSEISRLNQGHLTLATVSNPVRHILALAEETKRDTNGYFDVYRQGVCDPSGLVKGWAIYNAAAMLAERGFRHYFVEAGGDIQAMGHNEAGEAWRVGIRNPFNMHEIVKVLSICDCGVATSGTYVRGQHIYNPKTMTPLSSDVLSLTVIGPNIYEADRFATAAFAMGAAGIEFIERLEGFEGYQIDQHGMATFTSGFAAWEAR